MSKQKLYDNGYFTVDNFLSTEMCEQLRSYALECDYIEDLYPDYYAVNYSSDCGNKKISNLVTDIIPNILKEKYPFLYENGHVFQRGWYFIHDNQQFRSVQRHKDPGSYITANLWVTPDEYRQDTSIKYNGFIIHTLKKSVIVPYKFNRLTLFFSQIEHESQLARFKPKKNERKVNFTFLFGPKLCS